MNYLGNMLLLFFTIFLNGNFSFFVVFFSRLLKKLFFLFRDEANTKERYISLCIPLKECEINKIPEKLQKS